MQPWMSASDIKLIEHEILKLGKPHVSVLEWGSGGSTKHFSDFMRKNNITYDWVSIEYNRAWYNKVKALSIPDVNLVLFDVGNEALRQRKTNMDDYVDYPLILNKKFDFILVDGRKRRRCLINAARVAKHDSTVLLHDAQRKYYHCAFESFRYHSFLSPTLWAGRTEDLISVVMPVFNIASHITYFRRALSSIINQTYENWELIIVCDGGSPVTIHNVCKVIKECNDPRIKFYSSSEQSGPGITRNYGTQYISGNYVTFHDSDDWSKPDRFERLMGAMDGYGVVASNVLVNFIESPNKNRVKSYPGATLLKLIDNNSVKPPIHFSSALISTELFKELGGFEHYKFSSDSLLALKLGYLRELIGAPPIPVIPYPLFVWVRHPNSITTKLDNAHDLKKCIKRQRKPLSRAFREALVSGEIRIGSPIGEIRDALKIIDNLSTSHKLNIINLE